ncbi:Cupin domain family protein [Desulfamplus magnetovallimortis]|uniref:Cupin domain family protein n=1 Tax=Desulfamplus magnetovallimortis TaxID=1246637 RepID=A0A1W1HGQ1_9BACT|nr:cupin domain-containing protein [Desulfamplus magnetovallimortis]SLM31640.1 Cupin domain family protein [Desulfamplus magnetovallimortis]
MKIITCNKIAPVKIDNDLAKGVSGRVVIGKNDGAPHFCMRLFELAPNGYTPQHSHEWEHEIFIHSGKGEVFSQNEWHTVSAGDAVFIKGDEIHQIRNQGNEPFVFICLVPSGAPEL